MTTATTATMIEFSRPAKELREMTAKELEELKVQWYAEAKMRGVLPIIADVARLLGKRLNTQYGPKYEWLGDSPEGQIIIFVDDYGCYFHVTVRGKRVVNTHECDRLFVPGAWLEPILALHQEALDRKTAAQIATEETTRSRLLEMLGALSDS